MACCFRSCSNPSRAVTLSPCQWRQRGAVLRTSHAVQPCAHHGSLSASQTIALRGATGAAIALLCFCPAALADVQVCTLLRLPVVVIHLDHPGRASTVTLTCCMFTDSHNVRFEGCCLSTTAFTTPCKQSQGMDGVMWRCSRPVCTDNLSGEQQNFLPSNMSSQ